MSRWPFGRWWMVLLLGCVEPYAGAATASAQSVDSVAAEARAPGATLDLKVLVDVDLRIDRDDAEVEGPTFGLRRVRLITQGTLGDRSAYRVLLEPSWLALGPEGNAPFRGAPLVEAVLDYRISNAFVVHAGQQRLPFGLSASALVPSLPTPEYPQATRILMQRVSVFRDIGLSISGRVDALEYSAGIFNGAGINVGADNNDVRDFVGRVSYSLLRGWTVGGSAWGGRSGELYAPDGAPQPTFHDDAPFRRWGVDARFVQGPGQIWVEYLTDRTDHNPEALNPTPERRELERSGWNVLAAYRVRSGVELVGRYDRWQPLGSGERTSAEYVAGVQWYPLETRAPPDSRTGPPPNAARRHSRILLFLEHLESEAARSSTILRLRWQLFY